MIRYASLVALTFAAFPALGGEASRQSERAATHSAQAVTHSVAAGANAVSASAAVPLIVSGSAASVVGEVLTESGAAAIAAGDTLLNGPVRPLPLGPR